MAANPKKAVTVPAGFAALTGGNCSFNGEEYVAVDGVVIVPVEAVQSLLEHDFVYASTDNNS